VRLLSDLQTLFSGHDVLATETILCVLNGLDEAPWGEILNGKPLNARALSQRLRPYGVNSKTVRIGNTTPKGYAATDFADAWSRYLPSSRQESATSATDGVSPPGEGVADDVADSPDVADESATSTAGSTAQKAWRCPCGSYERDPAMPAECESWRCLGCGESPPACSRLGCEHPAVFFSDCAHHASRGD
jgi:hypothetical protein